MPSLFKFGDKEVNPSVGFQTGSRPKQSNVRRWRWVIGFGIFIVIVVAIALLVYFLMKKETGPSLSPEFQGELFLHLSIFYLLIKGMPCCEKVGFV